MIASRGRTLLSLVAFAALALPASAAARFGGGTGHFGGRGGGFGGHGGGFGGRAGGGGFGFPHFFFFGGGGGGLLGLLLTLFVLYVLFQVGRALYRAYRDSQSAGGPGPLAGGSPAPGPPGASGGIPGGYAAGPSAGGYSAPNWKVSSLEGRHELKRAQEARRQAELATADDEYWDPEALNERVRECFLSVQDAWRQRNAGWARPFVSDALFDRIEMQLKGMERQGRFDRLEDVALERAQVVRIHNVTNDSEDRFVVHLKGWARDWIEDAQGQLIDGSTDLQPFTEFWTFGRHPEFGWVVDEVQQEEEGKYHLKTADVNRDDGPAVYER
ncbi:MAG TPA: Tim44-like domain-containing protein [Solirubrobacteraceae bacterium]|jgi:predicted lipid-binding transport protein (Tim44 family)|nr:Tim44-like domain-containing protein [Solirubrobacteraceae bacterium]